MSKKDQRNVEINETTWRNVGSLAALLGKTKKEVVTEALDFYYYNELAAQRKFIKAEQQKN